MPFVSSSCDLCGGTLQPLSRRYVLAVEDGVIELAEGNHEIAARCRHCGYTHIIRVSRNVLDDVGELDFSEL